MIFEEDVSLKELNTYRIGGKTHLLTSPLSNDELKAVWQKIKEEKMSYYVLGNGSNVILPDEDFAGIVISLNKMNNMVIKDDILYAKAGVKLNTLNNKLFENGYINFAWASMIPGTVGGSVRGNAGANGHDMFEYLISIDIMDNDGNFKTILKDEVQYSYRFTNLENCIILGARFKLEKGDVESAKKLLLEQTQKRIASQPLEYPNAGSVFKNPTGDSAGRLIDSLNLKGYKIGGAMISLKHANFIVNTGDATAKDIISLIDYVKNMVKEAYNIDLELEQKIVKWNYEKEN